jgi:O-methyltransferase
MKHKIFPLHINDVTLNFPEDYKLHQEVINLIKKNNEKIYLSDIIFIMKYKKFVERDDVYSMGDIQEIQLIEECINNIIKNNIEGDIIEAGVWKGGMAMWMKNLLNYYGDNRKLWLFDTFGIFPESLYDKDKKIHLLTEYLFSKKYDINDVRNNFKKLNLLDDTINFVVGDFKDTVPKTDISKIAILRLDSDYYDATLIMLEKYYFKIVKGGYIIIDDYNNEYLGAKEAILFFRNKYNIMETIINKGNGYVYWQVR